MHDFKHNINYKDCMIKYMRKYVRIYTHLNYVVYVIDKSKLIISMISKPTLLSGLDS